MLLTESDLTHIQDLYDRGLYLQGYEAALAIAPLQDWRGPAGRILAARLAGNLGSGRLGSVLYALSFREHPDHERARYFGATAALRRLGPYPTLKLMDRLGDTCGEDDGQRAEWLALRGYCYAQLRDFESADRDIGRALEMAPQRRWLAVQHAGILEAEDQYPEALRVIENCLERHPWYRPAVQSAAHLRELNGNPDGAIELLTEACERLECGDLHIHLAGLHRDRQRIEQAREQYDLAAAKYPLLDEVAGDSWLNRVRSDLACQLGDYELGLSLLKRIQKRYKGHFHKKVQATLEANQCRGTSKQLDVPFVRQHHVTCAPATLTMLAHYWGKEAEHLQIADEICYDGTPYHAERRWAEEQGYTVREFTLTPEAARGLIDRGVPFTFSTVEPTNGHLQAVIGYDTARGVLLLRDPFYPSVGEVLDSALVDRYGPYGPRAMALVPPEQDGLLDGLDLPDAAAWDLTHQMRCHLIEHRRDEAVASVEALERKYPGHTLALGARLSLADYDGDTTARLERVEQLLDRYPKCPAIAFRKFICLNEQGRQTEAAALLDEWRHKKERHPVFLEEYARLISRDARQEDQAYLLLREAVRRGSRVGENYYNLAGLLWSRKQQEEATTLYRYAACLNDHREGYAMAYFRAQRVLGNEQQTLELLQRRLERFGTKSAGPARTLFEACRLLGRTHDGIDALQRAMELRPDDGDLMLYAANELGVVGRYDDAMDLLQRAKGKTHETGWLRAAAFLARDSGDNNAALKHWERVAELSPLDVVAQQELADLKARVAGPEAGVEHLRACVDRFPYHLGLLHALYSAVRGRSLEESDAVLQRILEHHPHDAWAHRERGYNLIQRPNGLEEAQRSCETAYAIDPRAPETLGLRGRIARLQGRPDDARHEFRQAVLSEVDYTFAIDELVDLAPDRDARREVLAFVFEQIQAQAVFGDSIAGYAHAARRALDDTQIEQDLRAILAQRETLHRAWAALIDHLLRAGRHDAARETAQQAVERFPLVTPLWNRLAEIERVRLDRPAQVRCLEQAIAISPDNRMAVRELAEVYQFDGRIDDAAALLEQAIDRNPHDTAASGQLADLCWATGQREKAYTLSADALEVDPYHDRLWSNFAFFAGVLGREDDVNARARAVAEQRPGEPNAWMTVAYHLQGAECLPERIAAVDRALELAPLLYEGYDLKAQLLCDMRRYDDALAACDPPALGGDVPYNLRGRAAWVEADRGRVETALEQMWALVEEHPDYTWGLEQICNWSAHTGDLPALTKASDRLVEIEPDNPAFLNYRAYAAMTAIEKGTLSKAEKAEKRAQAKQDLRHVAQLDPANSYSAVKLIDLHLEDKEYQPALDVLAATEGYLRDEEWHGKAVAIYAQQGEKDACRDALTQLFKVPTDNTDLLAYAIEQASKIGVADPVLDRAMQEDDTNPAVAREYIAKELGRRRWTQAQAKVDALKQTPEKWDHAAAALLTACAHEKPQRKRLVRFLNDNRTALARGEQSWGEAGYAMVCHQLHRMIYPHFEGWRERPGVKPWMLTNLTCAYLNEGRLTEAAEIADHCLQLPPDHSFPHHLTNLAHCEAVAGDPANAHALLDQAVIGHEGPGLRFEYHLARAAATARTPGPDAMRRAWAEIKTATRQFPNYRQDPASAITFKRAVKTVGAQGGLPGRLRAWLRLML